MIKISYKKPYEALARAIGAGIAKAPEIETNYGRFIALQNDLYCDHSANADMCHAMIAMGAYLGMQARLAGMTDDDRFETLIREAEMHAQTGDGAGALAAAINLGRLEHYAAADARKAAKECKADDPRKAAGLEEKAIEHFQSSLGYLERASEIFGALSNDEFFVFPHPIPIAGAPQDFFTAKNYTVSHIHMPYRSWGTPAHEMSLCLKEGGAKEAAREMSETALGIVDKGLRFMARHGQSRSRPALNLRLFEIAIMGEGAGDDARCRRVYDGLDDLRLLIDNAELPRGKREEWQMAACAAQILLADRVVTLEDRGNIRASSRETIMDLAYKWGAAMGEVPLELREEVNGTYRQAVGDLGYQEIVHMARLGADSVVAPAGRPETPHAKPPGAAPK